MLQKGNIDKTLTAMSNMVELEIIPFTQNSLSQDQMTDLIQKKNQYLHEVHAILCINLDSLEGIFSLDGMKEMEW